MNIDLGSADADQVIAWARGLSWPHRALPALVEKLQDLDEKRKPYEGRNDLTASQQRSFDKLRGESQKLSAFLPELEEERDAIGNSRKLLHGGGGRLSVGNEGSETAYRPDKGGFFLDIVRSKQDPGAMERLMRNQREQIEARDLTSSDPGAAGFIPPAYLGDAWAELPRASRPFADVVPTYPMPTAGTQVSVPRVQSGATVAAQASENAAISETDLDSESVTANLVTIAGFNDISLQALERSYPGMDKIIFGDLMAAHDSQMDVQLLSGSGASGQHRGLRNVTGKLAVTFTSGSPTGALLLPKVYDAIQQVASNRFRNADTIVMHPRRAAWLAKELSSTFPLFQQGSLNQAVGEQQGGFSTSFGGLRVVLDPNVGVVYGASTSEDEIYVLHVGDSLLMEGPVMSIRFDDVLSANMTVRLRLHSFSFFVPHRQPKSIAVISGTGLILPSF